MITNTPSGATIIATAGIHVIDITTMTDVFIVVGTDERKTVSDSRGRANFSSWPFFVLVLIRVTNASLAKRKTSCLFSDSACDTQSAFTPIIGDSGRHTKCKKHRHAQCHELHYPRYRAEENI